MSKTYAIAAGAAVVALLGGTLAATWKSSDEDIFAECRTGQVAGGAIGGPFELVDENGTTVTDADIITGPTLIYFGYTFCPDVCPLDNMRNAQAIEILDEQGIDVTPVFISIDPERDTVDVVRDFTDNFHERMIGLTGTPEQVKAASQAYRTYYNKQDGDDEYYLVDHTTMSYFMFPDIGLMEFYRRDVTPEQMAESLACFVDAAS
ncbi:SCO family protein [Octadecabacter sp. 1_MG-2023]|uniref:SCO family protein n=1 Tax=unclassified Octadecabacter TaxID=196158 RepID=UPI001C08D3F2|nr:MULTISPECIES: SCO family protein [unclassified Octadecabacter]MBU2992334.1 SCO family protein [Octadecabacter sp. B2R22]MDO6734909.1 SCO family protein [Octadecabacter sp. 1_MG-2023]